MLPPGFFRPQGLRPSGILRDGGRRAPPFRAFLFRRGNKNKNPLFPIKGTGPAGPALPAKNGPGGTCKAVFVFKNPSGIKEKNEKSRRGKGRGLAACRCAPPHAVPSGSTAADATAPRWPLAFGFRAFGPPPEELAHRGRTVRNTAQIRRFRNRPNHARGCALCEPGHPKNAEFCTRAAQVGGVDVRRFPPQDFAPYPVRPPGPVPGGPVRIHRRRADLFP